MFTPKRSIPALAAGATLTLAGCGDDPQVSISSLQVALSAFCLRAVDCIPGQTVNNCVSYFVQSYFPPECIAPLRSYLECGASVDCQSFAITPIPQCAQLEAAASAACP